MKLITKKNGKEIQTLCKILLLQENRKLLKKLNRIQNKINIKLKNNENIKSEINEKSTLLESFIILYASRLIDKVRENLNNSKNAKKKRIKKRLEYMIRVNPKIYFITLTYTNKQLEKSSEEWRRKEITILLNKNRDYIANVDYGDKTQREHYHILTTAPIKWKKGHSETKEINTTEADIKKLTNYITKLTAHAIKESTQKGKRTPRIIYKRLIKDEWDLPF